MPESTEPKFEESLGRLSEIVHELEEGDLGLEESLARYEEGVKNLNACYQALEKAERRVQLLTGVDSEGNPVTQPFDSDAAEVDEQIGRRSRRAKQKKPCDPPTTSTSSVDEGPSLF